MLAPRHTLESVATKLADGLNQGSVILRPDEAAGVDVDAVETQMRVILARYHRREIAWLTLNSVTILVSMVLIAVQAIAPDFATSVGASGNAVASFLLGTLAGALTGSISRSKTQERSVELKTYLRLLKMADSMTARQLMLQIAPRLPGKEFVH